MLTRIWGRAGIGAVLAATLLSAAVHADGITRPSSDVSTFNVAHEVTFQYPSSWDVALDSAHVTAVQSFGYLTGEAVDIDSPDGAASVLLVIRSDPRTPLQDLQLLADTDAADPTGHPNFRLISPPAATQVAGAESAATAEYVYAYPDGSLQRYFQLEASRGGIAYQLESVVSDAALSQYQSQVEQILTSFQLLPPATPTTAASQP